jgi:hypothetical protein
MTFKQKRIQDDGRFNKVETILQRARALSGERN